MNVKNCENCVYAIKAPDVLPDQRVCIRANVPVDVDHYCGAHQTKEPKADTWPGYLKPNNEALK